MPNKSITHKLGSHNGSDRTVQNSSPRDLNFPETSTETPKSPHEDWSSLTKELVDTLPRAWTRGLLYILAIFAAIAVPWAMLSKIDETGTAKGRLEPKGKIIKLDAPVAGEVAALKVKEGQQVRGGQTLMVLKSEIAQAELQQARANLIGQLNRIPLLEMSKKQTQMYNRTQRSLNQAQASTQSAQINQIRQQLRFHQTEFASARTLVAKDRDIVQRFRSLRHKGIVSALQVDEAERKMIENNQRLQKAYSDVKQDRSELKKQQNTYQGTLQQGELALIESNRQTEQTKIEIAILEAEIAQTRKQIQSLLYQLQQREIHAPIDGTIFQFPIKSAGSVVQPGNLVAQIAPQGTALILKAQMPSPESGFLRVGLPVKMKFDAYPFQDYGIVQGKVRWISPDSKVVETPQGKVENFEIEITLEKPYVETPSKRIALTPGQTATAEVIVRQRRVIDFVLEPFKKLQKGGLEL